MSRLLVVLCLTLHVLLCGQPAARAQGGTGLYLGPGRVLRAAAPRQLSLNAHVSGFLFQPGGLSVAYVGTHDGDGQRTVTVWFADARREATARLLFRATGDAPDAHVEEPHTPGIDLIGWTPDARRLLLRQIDQTSLAAQYISVDVSTEPFHVRQVPTPQPVNAGLSLPSSAWSPDQRRLLMIAEPGYRPSDTKTMLQMTTAEIYDPTRDQALPILVPDGCIVWGWLDTGRLLFLRPAHSHGEKAAFLIHDIATGADTESPRPAPWPPPGGVQPSLSLPAADPVTSAAPGLTLENKRENLSDTQSVAGTRATSIWVRRAGAPKPLSAIAVGVTPGADDPQATWSPSGRAVAFVAHEDLFVADLTERDATPYEKVAAGERLGCDEERAIIEANLKQIGLGLLQYNQDNDEKFPPSAGWHDAVYPYVKNEGVFSFAGVPIVYHVPPGVTLASIDSPATTVLLTADTPCAHVVLYADGHAKSYDKQGHPLPKPEP